MSKVRILYDFIAEASNEITAYVGEELSVVDPNAYDGWIRVRNSRGIEGIVPGSYAEYLTDDNDDIPPPPSHSTNFPQSYQNTMSGGVGSSSWSSWDTPTTTTTTTPAYINSDMGLFQNKNTSHVNQTPDVIPDLSQTINNSSVLTNTPTTVNSDLNIDDNFFLSGLSQAQPSEVTVSPPPPHSHPPNLDEFDLFLTTTEQTYQNNQINPNVSMPNDLDIFMGLSSNQPTQVNINLSNNDLDMLVGTATTEANTISTNLNDDLSLFMSQDANAQLSLNANLKDDDFFSSMANQTSNEIKTADNNDNNNNEMSSLFMDMNISSLASNQAQNNNFLFDQFKAETQNQSQLIINNSNETSLFDNFSDDQFFDQKLNTTTTTSNVTQSVLTQPTLLVNSNEDFFGFGNQNNNEQILSQTNQETYSSQQGLNFGFDNPIMESEQQQQQQNLGLMNQSSEADFFQFSSNLSSNEANGRQSSQLSSSTPMVPATIPVGDPKSDSLNSSSVEMSRSPSNVTLRSKPTVKRSFNPFSGLFSSSSSNQNINTNSTQQSYNQRPGNNESDSDFDDDESHNNSVANNSHRGSTMFSSASTPTGPGGMLTKHKSKNSYGLDTFLLFGSVVKVSPDSEYFSTIFLNEQQSFWKAKSPPYRVNIVGYQNDKKYHGVKKFISYEIQTEKFPQKVKRRYNHFDWLFKRLEEKYPNVCVPPVPDKAVTGNFEDEFIMKRRAQLELWLNYLSSHPVINVSEVFIHFLQCDEASSKWKSGKRKAEKDEYRGAQWFCTVTVPGQSADSSNLIKERVEKFSKATIHLENSVKNVSNALEKISSHHSSTYKKELVNLGKRFEELGSSLSFEALEVPNNAALSRAMVTAGNTYVQIGNAYGEQAKEDVSPLLDRLSLYRGIVQQMPDIVQFEKNAISMYEEFQQKPEKLQGKPLPDVAANKEIISHVTFAEINHFNKEKVDNLTQYMRAFLSKQIAFYTEITDCLKRAQVCFEQIPANLTTTSSPPSNFNKSMKR